jgi:hypothetical protein
VSVAYLPSHGWQPVALRDLVVNAAGWQLVSVAGLNNLGQIAGMGLINGQRHGFVLTPAEQVAGQ